MSCTGSCHSHINFTSKGKLLLIDVEKAKRDEFNRRRKIRLQQVRQQSNDIAREIRNKVKVEKLLKCSQEELKKQAHFDRWKEAQIKALQDDFNRRAIVAEQDKENALKEVELAELEKERLQVLDEIAKKRGNLAVLKQRRDKLDDESKSFLKASHTKFNRSLENLRSALISSLPKPDNKKSIENNAERSPERRIPQTSEIIDDVDSEESQDPESVMTIIKGDGVLKKHDCSVDTPRQTLASCKSSSTYSPSHNSVSPGRVSRQNSWSYSPDRRCRSEFSISPRNLNSERWSSSRLSSRREGPHTDRNPKVSFQSGVSRSSNIQHSPNKRLASNVLMSPNKRIAGMDRCSHSKDSSPVRCNKCYSPNKFKDDLDHQTRSRHVRFEDIDTDESHSFQCPLGRSKSFPKGDSDFEFESDSTWPPRNWNRHQKEPVILYDHCGRTASKYQPKHTVTVISDKVGDEELELEIEACRERAIRRHEDKLRERRGCRAMYRQRLRAEFSCMISDLANLDRHARLAKLETDAKIALFPKRCKQKPVAGVENNKSSTNVEKHDTPGRVQVTDCIEGMDVDVKDAKSGAEITRQDLMDCNLDALDELLARLKEQRDHLLACHEGRAESKGDGSKTVQSTSVQCSVPFSTDSTTSPRGSSRGTSPIAEIQSQDMSAGKKKSRSPSPVVPVSPNAITNHQDKQTPVLEDSPPEIFSKQSVKKPQKSQKNSVIVTSSSTCKNNKKQASDKVLFSQKTTESIPNDSKQVTPTKTTDKSDSTVSIDNYSFDGVKVEVKVSKSKGKKITKEDKTKNDKIEEKDVTDVSHKNDLWSKKLYENSSSTGTSYMSPPEELNPDEHKLLISVLEGMDRKNSNPVLGMYIQKLLSMSKGSLENMSISISDDSKRSEDFKSCYGNGGESSEGKGVSQLSSFFTARSHDNSTKKASDKLNLETKLVGESMQPVKVIIESSDSSLIGKDVLNSTEQNEDYEAVQNEHFIASSQYIDALSLYNKRLKLLARMMSQENYEMNQPVKKSFSENDTSYIAVPSDLNASVKLTESAQEFDMLRPDDSYISESVEEVCPSSAHPVTSSWGIRSNILPRPDPYPERTVEKKPRPPSIINRQMMEPHELSTIAEVDSRIVSGVQPGGRRKSTSTERVQLIGEEKNKSEEESYHTLPPTGFPLSSESSLISANEVSPIKPADESSLHIFTELPDSSFGGQSSAEEVAVSEVFRSVGIGWALSTWRKTHEASRKIEETSSSSLSASNGAILSKKKDDIIGRHSTPIKTTDAEKNMKITESDDNRLTPPSVTLYQRYQNLICSVSNTSPSNDS